MATETTKSEGFNLLGDPTFTDIQNGRFRCVETGHELLEKDRESYSLSKRCRLGLVEYALSRKKPPLNLFKQDPNSRSKLICKMTGYTVNKSEQHIWKHLNGRRFLNKLEEKELEKESKQSGEEMPTEDNGAKGEKKKKKKNKKKTNKKKKEKKNGDDEEKKENEGENDSEEVEFWMPPVGERWDFDDGAHRWDSGSDSEDMNGDDNSIGEDKDDEPVGNDSEDLSKSKKRKSEEVNPSDPPLKQNKNKKKKKKKTAS